MYEECFSFQGSPFRLAPDPKFFFGSKSHNKAMAYLHYGLRQAEGFIVITGEIGAGKSVLIGHLLDQLDRSSIVAANLPTPNIQSSDLLSHILSAFRIEPSGAGKTAEIEAFEDFLFDQLNHGRRVLLVVDEAQNLPLKTLEELRVLSNMEYDGTPLFQVFLVGQPDFRETMARGDMEQLRQRVIASYHLEPLTREETEKYVKHRLGCVGWKGRPSISIGAFDAIYAATGGLPRKIHKLCNRVLLFAAVEQHDAIEEATVKTVLYELLREQASSPDVSADDVSPIDANTGANANMAAESQPEKLAANASAPAGAALDPDTVKVPVVDDAPPLAQDSATEPVGDSVFDRLRAKRKTATSANDDDIAQPPRSATLDEVAVAIAAVRDSQRLMKIAANDSGADAAIADAPASIGPFDAAEMHDETSLPESGWKKAVFSSISETRDELKRAHQSVGRLRKQLTEIDSRRRKRRQQIAASLDRAESLLVEIRDAWR